MRSLAVALVVVLLFPVVSFAGQRGIKYKEHTIHGRGYDKHAIENLLDDSETPAEVDAPFGKVTKLKGNFKIDRSKKLEDAAIDFIDKHRVAFGLKDPKRELKILRKDEHKEGDVHLRYNQSYNDVPVWGQELIVYFDTTHDLDHITSDLVPTPDLDTTPLLTEEEAAEIVESDFKITPGAYILPPEKKLVIYNDTLAYEIYIGSLRYFINAKSDAVIYKEDITVY